MYSLKCENNFKLVYYKLDECLVCNIASILMHAPEERLTYSVCLTQQSFRIRSTPCFQQVSIGQRIIVAYANIFINNISINAEL